MKSIQFFWLVLAVVVTGTVMAADDGLSGAANRMEKKPEAAATTASASTAPKEETLKGMLADKPADAKTGVVAALKVTSRHDKAEPKTVKTYNLVAGGDIATQLADLLAKKARVEVGGLLDGETLTVTKVTILASKKQK